MDRWLLATCKWQPCAPGALHTANQANLIKPFCIEGAEVKKRKFAKGQLEAGVQLEISEKTSNSVVAIQRYHTGSWAFIKRHEYEFPVYNVYSPVIKTACHSVLPPQWPLGVTSQSCKQMRSNEVCAAAGSYLSKKLFRHEIWFKCVMNTHSCPLSHSSVLLVKTVRKCLLSGDWSLPFWQALALQSPKQESFFSPVAGESWAADAGDGICKPAYAN